MPTLPKSKQSALQKTKITVQIDREIFESFRDAVEELNLRRDAFLNLNLRDEIECLREAPKAGKKGEGLLKALRAVKMKDMVAVGIKLDKALAEELVAVCAEKRIQRDVFVEACLPVFTKALQSAATYISSPGNQRPESGYAYLMVSDEEVESWLEPEIAKFRKRVKE